MDFFDAGFCVHTPSWHEKEDLLTVFPTDLDEALTAGFPRRDGKPGHWEPIALPVYDHEIGFDPESGEPLDRYVEVEGWFQIKRDDDPTVRLSIPKDSYTIIHNRTIGEIVQALAGEGAEFDTMFSVKDGAQIGCTMLLDEPLLLAGDDSPSVPFLSINSSHDGSSACRAGYGVVRQVCANTIMLTNLAWDQGELPSYTFKHSAGVKDRIVEAKSALTTARQAFERFRELSEELASMPCSEEQLEDFLAGFVPEPEAATVVTKRQRSNIDEARNIVRGIVDGPTIADAHRDTALALVNGAVEYLDHYRKSRSTDTLVRRTLMGSADFKQQAIDLAREVCLAN